MGTSVAGLIDKLKAKQGNQSDVAFARQLGLSRQTWAFLKDGTRNPGKRAIKQILIAFPDLTIDVMNYLHEEN